MAAELHEQSGLLQQIGAIQAEVAAISDRVGCPRAVLVIWTPDGFVHTIGDNMAGERVAMWKRAAEASWSREGT